MDSTLLRLAPLASPGLRCAVCHGPAGSRPGGCSCCRTVFHAGCRAAVARCPTLGCGDIASGRAANPPLRAPSAGLRRGASGLLERLAVLSTLLATTIVVLLQLPLVPPRQARVVFDLEVLDAAAAAFHRDLRRPPRRLDELWCRPPGARSWRGPYLSEYPVLDPWGGAYLAEPSGAGWTLHCLGADGLPGGDGRAADTVRRGAPPARPSRR